MSEYDLIYVGEACPRDPEKGISFGYCANTIKCEHLRGFVRAGIHDPYVHVKCGYKCDLPLPVKEDVRPTIMLTDEELRALGAALFVLRGQSTLSEDFEVLKALHRRGSNHLRKIVIKGL
jgi:hypothetical protein